MLNRCKINLLPDPHNATSHQAGSRPGSFPNRPLLESYTGELVEYYASNDDNILGAIDHEGAGAWSYVVLKRNPDDALRVVEINEKMISHSAATTELFRKMAAACLVD